MILTQSCSRCASFCQMGGGAFRMLLNRPKMCVVAAVAHGFWLRCVFLLRGWKSMCCIALLFVVGSGWLLEITSMCWNQWDYKLNGCSIRWGSCYSWWMMFPSETTINFPFVSATGSASSRVVSQGCLQNGTSSSYGLSMPLNAYHHFFGCVWCWWPGRIVAISHGWFNMLIVTHCHIYIYIYLYIYVYIYI